jgi:L-lactate dehydrogenase complex protein LldG
MTSRARVLDRIRAALGADAEDMQRRSVVATRLADPPRHPIPARASRPRPELMANFEEALRSQGADLIAVAVPDDIPPAVAGYLTRNKLRLRIRAGTDPYFAKLAWSATPDLVLETGPAQDNDGVGLSHAVAGVAETGTLVLASGPDNPVTLAFMPDTHIVVLAREAVVGSYEDARALLGATAEETGWLPRTVNLVSAPSRTSDIGGKTVMGAHGPRRLAVILVGASVD